MELQTTTSETTMATAMHTSSVDVDVAQATSHHSTVKLMKDIITNIINAQYLHIKRMQVLLMWPLSPPIKICQQLFQAFQHLPHL